MSPTYEMLNIAIRYKPNFICLVPEKRKEITTEGGLNIKRRAKFVGKIINQLKKMYDKRSEKYIKHYVGAAVENFLLKITDMGLASCWVGPFSEETLRNHFSIPENNEIELIITVGYEFIKGKSKPKRKHSLVNRVFFEDWGNKFHKPLEKVRRKDI